MEGQLCMELEWKTAVLAQWGCHLVLKEVCGTFSASGAGSER